MKRSESATKPNCGVAQSTISSAKRERCTAQIDAAASASSAKSRSDDGVERVRRRPVEAERLRGHVAVDRERRAGERRRAERRFVQPLARIGEAAAVARQHLDIGEEMMAEGHRLRALQMREARHHRVGMRPAPSRRAPLAGARAAASIVVDGVAHPEPEVGRDLVVARARRVQPPGRRRRSARASRASTFMWMSSSARENVNLPASISAAIVSRPASDLASHRRAEMMP